MNGGADEGTDTLSNVEFVEHGGGRYVLFGNGGFATLKEAVEAATHPGDTIKFAETPTDPITIDVTDTNDDINVTIPYDVPTDIHTGDGDNHIVTGGGDDNVTTGIGDDTVKTGDGNDVVDTGGGDDTIIGGSGLGDDVYDGGPNADTVIYSSATNSITVDLNATPRSGQPVNGADGPRRKSGQHRRAARGRGSLGNGSCWLRPGRGHRHRCVDQCRERGRRFRQ